MLKVCVTLQYICYRLAENRGFLLVGSWWIATWHTCLYCLRIPKSEQRCLTWAEGQCWTGFQDQFLSRGHKRCKCSPTSPTPGCKIKQTMSTADLLQLDDRAKRCPLTAGGTTALREVGKVGVGSKSLRHNSRCRLLYHTTVTPPLFTCHSFLQRWSLSGV